MANRLIFSILLLVAGSAANAAMIDFTSDDWSGADGRWSYGQTVEGVGGVHLTSTGGRMTFNARDNAGCTAGNGDDIGLACDGDGIGIRDDEITSRTWESLTVTFSSAVDVISIILLDLFEGEPETAVYSINRGIGTEIAGGLDLGGLVVTRIDEADVTRISFWARGSESDFALAGIEASAVPLPGALILFMSGLGMLGLGFKRKKAAST